jgi:RNA polymerase sigma-70 factor (ECF subfamily)
VSRRDGNLRLYLEHRAALVDYAAPIVGDRARAEDIVQEAWLRFTAALDSRGGGITHPVGYLYRIVRNLAVDLSRRLSVEAWQLDAAELLDSTPTPAPGPERQAAARSDLRRVAAALAELPPRKQMAFDLHRFEGRTFAEIGAALGISQTQAHNLVRDALVHCMRRLEAAEPPPAGKIAGDVKIAPPAASVGHRPRQWDADDA